MNLTGVPGPPASSYPLGVAQNLRLGNMGDLVVTEAHGKYYEAAYRGKLFSWGGSVYALTANTLVLSSTGTPIVGVYNPTGSGKNVVIAKVKLQIVTAGNSAAVPGGFVYAQSIGNTAVSTGNAPFNRGAGTYLGSVAKGFANGTVMTGLTTSLSIVGAAAFGNLVAAQGATATPAFSPICQEEFDGGWIVPPGGMWGLFNTVSTTTISVATDLIWEEEWL